MLVCEHMCEGQEGINSAAPHGVKMFGCRSEACAKSDKVHIWNIRKDCQGLSRGKHVTWLDGSRQLWSDSSFTASKQPLHPTEQGLTCAFITMSRLR